MQNSHSFPGIIVRYRYKNLDVLESKSTTLTDEDQKDELHVNLWEIDLNNSYPFMDIGVMIYDHEKIEAVIVDLPWSLNKKNIHDLGAKLNGEKSVAAIFNEVVHYDGFAEGNFANISFIKDGKDIKPFSLLRLNSQSFSIEEINLSNDTPCTRLKVTLPSYPSNIIKEEKKKSAYIRFRIKKVPPTVYTVKFTQNDRALISSSTDTRIIDFRINVLRGVPEELINGDNNLKFPPNLDKIHCFLTTIQDEECVSVSKHYNGYRSLMDEDIWNEYVKNDKTLPIQESNSIKNYLGYQWTAKNKKDNPENIKDLIVLGRFSKKTSGLLSILRFMIIVIILGAMGSGVWETLSDSEHKNAFNFVYLSIALILCFIDRLVTLKKWAIKFFKKAKNKIIKK